MKDPIVEEVHRIREKHSKRFNYDLDAIVKDLQQREAQSRARGVKFITPRKRRRLTAAGKGV
jgi:hypothetical protein